MAPGKLGKPASRPVPPGPFPPPHRAMNQALQQIPEWHDVDAAVFRNEIATVYRPAVLRGIVRDWPAVRHAIESPESFCRYLNGFDSGKPVDVLLMPPHVKGRIFYNDKMSGFNFTRERQS